MTSSVKIGLKTPPNITTVLLTNDYPILTINLGDLVVESGDLIESWQISAFIDRLIQIFSSSNAHWPRSAFLVMLGSILDSVLATPRHAIVPFVTAKPPNSTPSTIVSQVKKEPENMTAKEAAAFLRMSERQLLRLRDRGTGPPWFVADGSGEPGKGKTILYRRKTIEEWSDKQSRL